MPDPEAIEAEAELLSDELEQKEEPKPTEEADEDKKAEAQDSEESTEETEETSDDEAAKPAKKDRVQKRIDRLTADKRAAERRADELQRQLLDSIAPKAPPDTQPPLKEADFDSYEDFLTAKAVQEAEKRVTARFEEQQQKQKVEQQRSRQAGLAETFQSRSEDAREKYDDFDDVAFDPTTPVTDTMMSAILESEAGPEIAYHLGSNHKEARRISLLSPISQAIELGKIEVALTTAPPKKQTAAPDPPKTLKGKSKPTKSLEDMTYNEFVAHRSKK